MKFIPFSKKYSFDENTLINGFPDYLLEPILDWVSGILKINGLLNNGHVDIPFRQNLQLDFKESFPDYWTSFSDFITDDIDRFCNLLAYLLQKLAFERASKKLESILRQGSSAYAVEKLDNSEEVVRGGFNLVYRVPEVIKNQADILLTSNQEMLLAWNDCYKKDSDLSGCVRKCNDFIEGYLRDKYWSDENKTPSVVEAIKRFNKNPEILSFKGDTFLKDRTHLISLLEGVANIRAEHKTGNGREPTSEEAEYILHTTIYIWNLMEKKV